MTWTDHPDLVDFYTSHRSAPDELYPSERRFLPWLASEATSVLDVGCAAGGFADVWRHWNGGLRYSGVDVSQPLVEAARKLHPESSFEVADCADGLPFEDGRFDTVAALGWLHWEPRYEQAIAEMWRVSGRRLFFDVRLDGAASEDRAGRQRLALAGDWDGETTVPYLVLAWDDFAAKLLALGPGAILTQGYVGRPSDTVTGMQGEISFATFVLERRGPDTRQPAVCADLPFDWPARFRDEVDLRDPEELGRLAPTEVEPQ
jgi:SAM-dependent methyltransferase